MTQGNPGYVCDPDAVRRVTAAAALGKYTMVVWSAEGTVTAPAANNNKQAFAGFVKDEDIASGADGEIITYGEALAICGDTITAGQYLENQAATGLVYPTAHTAADVIMIIGKALKGGTVNDVIPIEIVQINTQYNA